MFSVSTPCFTWNQIVIANENHSYHLVPAPRPARSIVFCQSVFDVACRFLELAVKIDAKRNRDGCMSRWRAEREGLDDSTFSDALWYKQLTWPYWRLFFVMSGIPTPDTRPKGGDPRLFAGLHSRVAGTTSHRSKALRVPHVKLLLLVLLTLLLTVFLTLTSTLQAQVGDDIDESEFEESDFDDDFADACKEGFLFDDDDPVGEEIAECVDSWVYIVNDSTGEVEITDVDEDVKIGVRRQESDSEALRVEEVDPLCEEDGFGDAFCEEESVDTGSALESFSTFVSRYVSSCLDFFYDPTGVQTTEQDRSDCALPASITSLGSGMVTALFDYLKSTPDGAARLDAEMMRPDAITQLDGSPGECLARPFDYLWQLRIASPTSRAEEAIAKIIDAALSGFLVVARTNIIQRMMEYVCPVVGDPAKIEVDFTGVFDMSIPGLDLSDFQDYKLVLFDPAEVNTVGSTSWFLRLAGHLLFFGAIIAGCFTILRIGFLGGAE